MVRLRISAARWFSRVPARFFAMLLCSIALSTSLYVLHITLNIVTLVDTAGSNKLIVSAYENPNKLATISGVQVGSYDSVSYKQNTGNGATMTVYRAFPINIEVDGEIKVSHITIGTVRDAVEAAGITLSAADYTVPELDTVASEGVDIKVHRVDHWDEVIEVAVEPGVDYIESSLLYKNPGKTYVLQEGVPGVKNIVMRQRAVDGVVQSETMVEENIVVEPQNTQILRYSTGAPVSDLPAPNGVTVTNGVPSSYSQVFTGRATGYSSARGRGSSGLGLYEGTVAVDPNVIPYGTKMYIESTDGRFVYGYAIATDTGAALRTGHAVVDLFYETFLESRLNAVQSVNVYILS